MSLKELSAELLEKGLITNQYPFEIWMRFTGDFRKVKAGKYRTGPGMSPEGLISMLTSGKTHHDLVLEWTIPEGFTQSMILERLARVSGHPAEDFFRLALDQSFAEKLLDSQATSLEGFLYPATYRFYDQLPAPSRMLKAMTEEFFRRLPETYLDQCGKHNLRLVEAVTFASLIEKETRYEEEKPLISEVIWNRLKKGMPLGIDASVIYGIDNFDGNLRRRHLQDSGNLYNSRIHKGLPPGPIGSPSLSSLKSVFSPADEGYYYYVLIPGNSGKHHFSKTLREHNLHVRKLVRAQRSRR